MSKSQTFKELVKSKGMTLRELADKVGVTERAVDHWCTGRNIPNLKIGYYVACALGITLEELAIVFMNQDR